MRYLLDTNILSDVIRNPQGKVAERIGEAGEDNVCTSIIVAAELRYGATKRNSPRLTAQVEAVLGSLEIIPLESPIDEAYGRLRAELERQGRPIGANDLWIAAQTLCLGYTLITANEGEFRRVEGLLVENWVG
ncbi:MAG: type II toxin-antitoxin system VapC family toxin [Magnetospirillum gryphiswaldense]|nr:type II toxin-antitoxin system VapC family toxin [Magnetospirillum gryphiswaldense]